MNGATSYQEVKGWSEEELATAVGQIAPAFGIYKDLFTDNGIDGATLLTLDQSDFEGLGIKSFHAKRLLKEISTLSGKDDPSRSPPTTSAEAGASCVKQAGVTATATTNATTTTTTAATAGGAIAAAADVTRRQLTS
jgi:hypothetical protein